MRSIKQAMTIWTVLLLVAVGGSCVDREEIVARGQDWVNRRVSYSQVETEGGYRKDCSGFVSMCWGLNKPGATTFTISRISSKIPK